MKDVAEGIKDVNICTNHSAQMHCTCVKTMQVYYLPQKYKPSKSSYFFKPQDIAPQKLKSELLSASNCVNAMNTYTKVPYSFREFISTNLSVLL